MKIEIGESLMLSYLKHVKKCVLYQTNWKVSSNWGEFNVKSDKVQNVYNKIVNHSEFSGIFKSEINQLIKQSEIDVIGLDSNNTIFTVDIAFHEAGLSYGNKTETKDRIFKKLLRSYLTLLEYFPNKKYELLFASPKVNPATEKIISDYFYVLQKDFTDEYVSFKYFSNDRFFENILKPTVSESINDSDTNELFIRSIILNDLFKKEKEYTPKAIPTGSINPEDHLILEFEPNDQNIFKQELIKTKQAKRILYYNNTNNNKIEEQIWNANKFTEESDLIGNIMGNHVIRDWRRLGIIKIRFEIIY